MSQVKIGGNRTFGSNWCVALPSLEPSGISGPRVICQGAMQRRDPPACRDIVS